jgi:hypothetical protein
MSGRKFRKKVVAVEDEEGEPESLAVPPSSIKAKHARQQKERKEKKLAGTSLLSFGDDEEAHGPALVKEKAKAKASGVRAAPAPALASASGPTATQISAPGGNQQSLSFHSACLQLWHHLHITEDSTRSEKHTKQHSAV